jgi:hypothetical protein
MLQLADEKIATLHYWAHVFDESVKNKIHLFFKCRWANRYHDHLTSTLKRQTKIPKCSKALTKALMFTADAL